MRNVESPDAMDVVRTTLDRQGRPYEVNGADTVVFDATTMRATYFVVLIASKEAVSCTCAPYKPVSIRSRHLLERWTRSERWHITNSEPTIAFACGMLSRDRYRWTAMMNGAELTPRSLECMIAWTLQLADLLDSRLRGQ